MNSFLIHKKYDFLIKSLLNQNQINQQIFTVISHTHLYFVEKNVATSNSKKNLAIKSKGKSKRGKYTL